MTLHLSNLTQISTGCGDAAARNLEAMAKEGIKQVKEAEKGQFSAFGLGFGFCVYRTPGRRT